MLVMALGFAKETSERMPPHRARLLVIRRPEGRRGSPAWKVWLFAQATRICPGVAKKSTIKGLQMLHAQLLYERVFNGRLYAEQTLISAMQRFTAGGVIDTEMTVNDLQHVVHHGLNEFKDSFDNQPMAYFCVTLSPRDLTSLAKGSLVKWIPGQKLTIQYNCGAALMASGVQSFPRIKPSGLRCNIVTLRLACS
ncbi:hypothetical protein EVG20_g9566 [Dentipellis fragilis]|uniref:Uncharacterized protein n=1 Tax=Dentipellis fragilis TaxID=205917 RepID=A0A4Y9XZ89_9AGAM|nr:hypothetical protein EVG20_g9566 [Dentipellis fragilis]